MVLTDIEYLISYLEAHNVPKIHKKRHTYLTYHGLSEHYTYILKQGIIKNSIILQDGREFNLSYIAKPDVISLLRDEVSKFTSQPFNVRIESDEATFYQIDRVTFWKYVNATPELQNYIKNYYRKKLSENIFRLQRMVMNGKKGAVCAFIYSLIDLFGRQISEGILIDFTVTNDDIAGFCGISSRSSVNRMLNELKQDGALTTRDRKFIITDISYLIDHIAN
ncbi:Crp/Fnr family transcriptional regulator [Loigolactobacillus coryniformis]|jgi:CRP-like cAMP-binding protein|uniref:Crp/Fnr family transcriptional regulator n=3 Tax=Loigolactobacillus coryniformis TaxID=1610 RepID=J2Z4A4_9LACO|nr:Crp/Fnr family transcriptional regulator [Loigolactobacillus coryniformis]ATO44484.1 Crp/Fnr family transcriptional regulator [Loigolactobacillus coryniformis subsp. torquens DSM 20004 = KCTC 3535]ATO56205.1 Crp/Fnr family transcriptional regulator [Loigolactobacillus coryniformis subsp. coryniformis KCTC 3167 = DSM 20001]EJN55273.1 Crp/Fnr family transcriptional regulator [Loigolactobacillus coryniformis subsp. coryniformis CECT 5711]KRK17869.1 transcription regulator [Loigolactobacillus co